MNHLTQALPNGGLRAFSAKQPVTKIFPIFFAHIHKNIPVSRAGKMIK